MKYYLISDNTETANGLRLAGIDGEVANGREQALDALTRCLADTELGILVVTEKIKAMCRREFDDVMLKRALPLVVEIPDSGGFSAGKSSMLDYIREAVGLKL